MDNTLKYRDYMGSVEYSAEDECFYGKVLGINDLVTFEGTSVAGLRHAFYEAVDDYLKMCEVQNKEPEKPYRGSFNVRVSSTLHRQAALYAASHGMTLNKLVEQAIERRVQQ